MHYLSDVDDKVVVVQVASTSSSRRQWHSGNQAASGSDYAEMFKLETSN